MREEAINACDPLAHILIWSREGKSDLNLIYESKSKNIDKNADFMLQSLDARICQEWRVV